jgi:hypothetical protein
MSASAYSLSAGFPADGFAVIAGDPVLGGLSKDSHYFCPSCMSWMFTRPPGADFLVNVRPTMLEERSWFAPFIETYTSNKFEWAKTGARRSYPEFPPMEEFESLIAEFSGTSDWGG